MTGHESWSSIEVLGGSCEPPSIAALTPHLAAQGETAIIAFADELAAALHSLDTPDRFSQDVRDVLDPVDAPVRPMSVDVFLYARAAVVGAGRAAYERVLADPAAMSGVWQVGDGELLLTVAAEAYERATGYAWDHETPLNPETGSNVAAWHGAGEAEQEPVATQAWFTLSTGTDLGVRQSPVYQEALFKLATAMTGDPAWITWWQATSNPALSMFVTFTHDEPLPWRVRRGRDSVQAFISTEGRDLLVGEWDEKHDRAAADLARWFAFIEERLGLTPPPTMPALVGPFSH